MQHKKCTPMFDLVPRCQVSRRPPLLRYMVSRCPVSRCQSQQFWWSRDVQFRVFSRPNWNSDVRKLACTVSQKYPHCHKCLLNHAVLHFTSHTVTMQSLLQFIFVMKF